MIKVITIYGMRTWSTSKSIYYIKYHRHNHSRSYFRTIVMTVPELVETCQYIHTYIDKIQVKYVCKVLTYLLR